MKKIIRDFLIYAVCASGYVDRYQRMAHKDGALVRVLAFHDVPNYDHFLETIKTLAEKYSIIRPEDFVAQKVDPKKINILLTFDDGYKSWVETVLPVMEKYEAKGLFFISSGLLAAAEDRDKAADFVRNNLCLQTSRQLLTATDAQLLAQHGHTIGGHTINHRRLAELSEQEIEHEVVTDKVYLEQLLKTTIAHFAYPFGRSQDFHDLAINIVTKIGYQFQYSAQPGWVRKDDATIPRLLIEENQSVESICRWVEGGYDVFYKLKDQLL